MNEFEQDLARHTAIAERDARKASTKPAAQQAEKDSKRHEVQPTPSVEMSPEQAILAAGYGRVHATPFFRSPKGMLFATAWLALEDLQAKAQELPEVRIWVESVKSWYRCVPEKV